MGFLINNMNMINYLNMRFFSSTLDMELRK